ncbi:hypothetical protein GCM10027088_25800 [Nocardia goodfellowii]
MVTGAVVVGAVVDVTSVVVAGAEDGTVVRGAAEVAGGTGFGVLDGVSATVPESEFDSDIAPSPANTMANAINTIASARNGGPPEVGLGELTPTTLAAVQLR